MGIHLRRRLHRRRCWRGVRGPRADDRKGCWRHRPADRQFPCVRSHLPVGRRLARNDVPGQEPASADGHRKYRFHYKTRNRRNSNQTMKLLTAFILSASIALGAAQGTPTSVDTNNVPTVKGALSDLFTAISYDKTNWIYEAHAMYAPALQGKYGGGVGAFYPINQYVFTGLRLDWVDGGFWMPSGSAGLQLPIHPVSWLHITPFAYAGIGIPLSGATVGNFSVPGHLRDNNGQATAILGYGAAIRIYTSKSGKWTFDLVGDRENWSGFAGQQYRGGFLAHMNF